MELSVIIPTFNRAAALGRTLASLCEQSLDPSRYEICVVNRGSTDVTSKVVGLVAAHYPHHNIIRIEEPRIEIASARNIGARHTAAPLIVQAIDDGIVPPDALEKFSAGFKDGDDIGKIGGAVVSVCDAPQPEWLAEGLLPLLVTSGFACYRRTALEQSGGFPMVSGHKGNDLLSAEPAVDQGMKARGWKMVEDPSVVVQQAIHADRLTPLWFRRRSFWLGVSDHAVQAYLAAQGIEANEDVAVELPLNADCWSFINDATEAPREEDLHCLRGLGRILAQRGFIPV